MRLCQPCTARRRMNNSISNNYKWDEQVFRRRSRLLLLQKSAQYFIDESRRRQAKVEITIGIDLGDVCIHYCTLNQDAEVVDRAGSGRPHRRSRSGFTNASGAFAMEAGTHSIWISEHRVERPQVANYLAQ